jgi:cardiolipin synthase
MAAFNVPNLLTYGRIAAVPVVVACYALPGLPSVGSRWLALVLFVVAAITDFLDGYLARAWKQQSSLGRMLDPIADKLLVAACLIVLVDVRTIAGRARSWSPACGSTSPSCASACRSPGSPSGRPRRRWFRSVS